MILRDSFVHNKLYVVEQIMLSDLNYDIAHLEIDSDGAHWVTYGAQSENKILCGKNIVISSSGNTTIYAGTDAYGGALGKSWILLSATTSIDIRSGTTTTIESGSYTEIAAGDYAKVTAKSYILLSSGSYTQAQSTTYTQIKAGTYAHLEGTSYVDVIATNQYINLQSENSYVYINGRFRVRSNNYGTATPTVASNGSTEGYVYFRLLTEDNT